MKTFNKVMLIIAGVVAALGIIFCVVAVGMGFSAKNVISSVVYNISSRASIKSEDIFKFDLSDSIDTQNSLTEPCKLESNMSLKVSAGIAKVIIQKSSDNTFYVTADNNALYSWKKDGNEMKVEARSKIKYGTPGTVKIYVPENYTFDEVNISFTTGEMNVNYLLCDEFKIEVGAGDVVCDNVKSNKFEAEVGAGNLEYNGQVNGDIKLEVGAGNVDLRLDNKETDYNYKIECAMGNVDVNKNSYTGFAYEKELSNNAKNTAKIECAMGNVTIKTK